MPTDRELLDAEDIILRQLMKKATTGDVAAAHAFALFRLKECFEGIADNIGFHVGHFDLHVGHLSERVDNIADAIKSLYEITVNLRQE